jgi:hypothetical protein
MEGRKAIAQVTQLVPAVFVRSTRAGLVLERTVQTEERNRRGMGKNLEDPAAVIEPTDVWVVAKALCLQVLPDGLGSQSSVPSQILPVGGVRSRVVAAESR